MFNKFMLYLESNLVELSESGFGHNSSICPENNSLVSFWADEKKKNPYPCNLRILLKNNKKETCLQFGSQMPEQLQWDEIVLIKIEGLNISPPEKAYRSNRKYPDWKRLRWQYLMTISAAWILVRYIFKYAHYKCTDIVFHKDWILMGLKMAVYDKFLTSLLCIVRLWYMSRNTEYIRNLRSVCVKTTRGGQE